jgi:hypothetical protein
VRRNAKSTKARHIGPHDIVDFHEFYLISRQWRAWKDFAKARQGMPSGKRNWNQHGLSLHFVRHPLYKLIIEVDVRATALECHAARFSIL